MLGWPLSDLYILAGWWTAIKKPLVKTSSRLMKGWGRGSWLWWRIAQIRPNSPTQSWPSQATGCINLPNCYQFSAKPLASERFELSNQISHRSAETRKLRQVRERDPFEYPRLAYFKHHSVACLWRSTRLRLVGDEHSDIGVDILHVPSWPVQCSLLQIYYVLS